MRAISERITVIILTASMVFAGFNCTKQTVSAQETGTDRYIVITKTDKAAEIIENKYSVSADATIKGADNVLSGTLTASQAGEIKEMKSVKCVEKDFTLNENAEENIIPDVKPAENNWEKKMIGASDAAETGEKIKICIIDSGIDANENVDVVERIDFINDNHVAGTDNCSKDITDEQEFTGKEDESTVDEEEIDDSDEEDIAQEEDCEDTGSFELFDDTCGHGTSVASVIAGKGVNSEVEGAAPNAELYSAKILDEERQAPVSRAVKAIYWAIDNDMDIINLSFGTLKYSEALEQAVNDAANNNILVIASAGNNGNRGIDYPARYESALSVGAVNAAGEVCDFSSKGDKIDVVAPGEAITAQANFGEDLTLTGTSLATPYVTAIAADLWSKDKSKPAKFIKELIKASGKTIASEDSQEYRIADYGYANEIYNDAYQAYRTKTEEAESESQEDNQSTAEKSKTESNTAIDDEKAAPDATSSGASTRDIVGIDNLTSDEEVVSDEEESGDVQKESEEADGSTVGDADGTYENEDTDEADTDISEEIDENDGEPQDLSEDTVKASWKKETHRKNACNTKMKWGASYPDAKSSTVSGMTANPLFHGCAKLKKNDPRYNYVAAYRYMAIVAKKYADGGKYSDVSVGESNTAGLTDKQYTKIRDFFKSLNSGKLGGNAKGFNKWKNREQASFIYGIDMHTATDAFAHSTYKLKSNGKFRRIKHADVSDKCLSWCCDRTTVYPNRAKIALQIEQNIVDRYKGNRKGIGYGRDFFVSKMKTTDNYKNWRINRLKSFAEAAKVEHAESLKYFGKISVTE